MSKKLAIEFKDFALDTDCYINEFKEFPIDIPHLIYGCGFLQHD